MLGCTAAELLLPACRDVIKAHDSVAIVLYHTGLRCFLLVRQFRPALYASMLRKAGIESTSAARSDAPPLAQAFTCELCAGIVDKHKSLAEIAQEEIREECGFAVDASNVQKLTSFIASVGSQGSTQTLFFASVDDSMCVDEGGGLVDTGESIELLGLPLDNVEAFVMDDAVPKSSGMMFGLTWAKAHVLATL